MPNSASKATNTLQHGVSPSTLQVQQAQRPKLSLPLLPLLLPSNGALAATAITVAATASVKTPSSLEGVFYACEWRKGMAQMPPNQPSTALAALADRCRGAITLSLCLAQGAQQLLPATAIDRHVQPGLFGADGVAGFCANQAVGLTNVVAACQQQGLQLAVFGA